MENVREIVLDILITLERDGGFEGKLIKAVLDKYDYLEQRDKAFIKRLAEGTIERRIELDYYIDGFSNTPVKKMKPLIRSVMRMSVYQIIYMDSVPDSAACNEACKLIQKRGFLNLKGFVNAVLRNISRNKALLKLPDMEENPVSALSVRYSMPQWIVEMWLYRYGEVVVKRLLDGLLRVHPVSLRFKTSLSGSDIAQIVKKIEKSGAKLYENPYLGYVYTAENIDNINELYGFADGLYTVQDVSSALCVEMAGIEKDDFIMDICAAPGGKTVLAAELGGRVLARDVSEHKILLVKENAARMQLSNIETQVHDACIKDDGYIEKADVLIMDVPCSGLGIMSKKRDIKYNVSSENIDSLNELQKNIVRNSYEYVKKGGLLIYSTCTINKKENEDMVRWIIENLPFEPVPIEDVLPDSLKEDLYEIKSYTPATLNLTEDDEILMKIDKCSAQFMPGFTESDGFFFAKLRRVGD